MPLRRSFQRPKICQNFSKIIWNLYGGFLLLSNNKYFPLLLYTETLNLTLKFYTIVRESEPSVSLDLCMQIIELWFFISFDKAWNSVIKIRGSVFALRKIDKYFGKILRFVLHALQWLQSFSGKVFCTRRDTSFRFIMLLKFCIQCLPWTFINYVQLSVSKELSSRKIVKW